MKIKRIDVTAGLLKSLITPGLHKHNYEVIQGAIPEDAELVRVHTDLGESSPRYISLFFTHESFPEIDPGTLLQSEIIKIMQYSDEAK